MNAQHRRRHRPHHPMGPGLSPRTSRGGQSARVQGGVSRLARAWRGAALGRFGYGDRHVLIRQAANDNYPSLRTRLINLGAGLCVVVVAAGVLLLLAA